MNKLAFPDGFIWGTATAAHQVEGNNVNSDFWVLEHVPGTAVQEPSGDACDHYHRYREDIAMLAELGFTSYRFSLEWARIEPEEGMFSPAVLAHYRDVLEICHAHGIAPMVTLHHFTSPRWLIQKGGWTGADTPDLFARYTERVMAALGDLIPMVCTLNEVNLPDLLGYIFARHNREAQGPVGAGAGSVGGDWIAEAGRRLGLGQGQRLHPFPYTYVEGGNFTATVLGAHRRAREVIRRDYPGTRTGFSLALAHLTAAPGGEAVAEEMWETLFKQYLPALQDDDFFGLQNYTRDHIGPEGALPLPADAERTQMGYAYAPEAVSGVIRDVARDLKIPILVTENGVATTDSRRVEFIRQALTGVHACIADGIPVEGYYYWSLFDNYEWLFGYKMTFGLVAVDRVTQARHIKESARYLGRIAGANALSE